MYSFLTTSSILKPDNYPQFASDQAIKFDRPAGLRPADGQPTRLAAGDSAYKRLTPDGRPDRQDAPAR